MSEAPLSALEALIFASSAPVGAAELRRVLGLPPAAIASAVQAINESLASTGRPYEIVEVAGGYRFRTRAEYGEVIASAQPERRIRLSRSALDALAVIAYRQPVTRPEIEEIRSVDCGAVLRTLADRSLIRIVGRRDAPGRPALYGTTPAFLETFGLSSLRDLPDLGELMRDVEARGTPIERAIDATKAGALAPDEDGSDAPPAGPLAASAGDDPDARQAGPDGAMDHALHEPVTAAGDDAGDPLAGPDEGAAGAVASAASEPRESGVETGEPAAAAAARAPGAGARDDVAVREAAAAEADAPLHAGRSTAEPASGARVAMRSERGCEDGAS